VKHAGSSADAVTAGDIMTRGVVSTAPEASLRDALALMLRLRVSGLTVVDASGALVGIVTEGDLLRRSELGTERHLSRWRALLGGPQRLANDYVHSHARRIEEIMSRDVATVSPAAPLAQVVALMEARRIRRVPVMAQGRLVGIVSRADLLRALSERLPVAAPPAPNDSDIRNRLLAQIDQQSWAPRECVDVGVQDGVVELRGLILHQAEREALRVMAENTLGVKGVVDRLVWIEPLSGTIAELPVDVTRPRAG